MTQRHLLMVLTVFWRPVWAWVLIAGVVVNTIILPLVTHTPADLTALIIASASMLPLIIARTYEKKHKLTALGTGTISDNRGDEKGESK